MKIFYLNKKPINDEPPRALFQNLLVNLNSHTILDNNSFVIADLDSKAEELLIYVEQFPKYGILQFELEFIYLTSKIFFIQSVFKANSLITTKKFCQAITNSFMQTS